MKKAIIAATAALLMGAGVAMAEGYQINSLSAKQIGMGHTGIALKLGSESQFFNPAGMAYLDNTIDLNASVTGISAHATATVDGKEYKTDNGISTPIYINAAFKIYDRLSAGLAFYTPYGSAINWTKNWPGAVLSQDVKLKTFTLQPTVSYAFNDKFSIGVGAMITWGNVDLNKGLVSAASADKALAMQGSTYTFGSTTPASVNLNGDSKIAVGINVGALYNVNEKVSIGLNYRSKMAMKVDAGVASVDYTGGQVAEAMLSPTLNGIHNANFQAEMPCPWVLGLGVSYKPVSKLTLAFDARLTGWKTYKSLDIEFLSEQLTDMNQHITKNYKNSMTYALGAQYAVTDRFDARLGLMLDTTPVNNEYYNPETPGMTKVEPTIGFSFRPIRNLSIDFGFIYVAGCGKKGATVTYDDAMYKGVLAQTYQTVLGMGLPADQALPMAQGIVAQAGLTPANTFKADYKLHAFTPSIGISYKF